MKPIAFVPAAIAAILALNISSASSQAACGKEYQVCMDTCATRATKSIQDGCFQGCESKNNFCSEQVFGKRPANAVPAATATAAPEPKAPARDAMAKTSKEQEAQPAPEAGKEPKDAPEQVAEQKPAEPSPKAPAHPKKAPHRAPARH